VGNPISKPNFEITLLEKSGHRSSHTDEKNLFLRYYIGNIVG
jgi:hypothetical protein